MNRVKDRQRLCGINYLVVNGDVICDRLSAFLFNKAVDLFEMRCCDLFGILADLDLGNNLSLIVFNGTELVNSAENGGALGGDKSFAYAECVNTSTLLEKVTDNVLVKSV